MPPSCVKGDDLSLCMDPSIRTTCGQDTSRDTRQLRQNALYLSLDSGGIVLPLKPPISRAIISYDRLDPHTTSR